MSTIVNFICSMIIFLYQFMAATTFERKQIPFAFFVKEIYPCITDYDCPSDLCKASDDMPKCVAGLCKCVVTRFGQWER